MTRKAVVIAIGLVAAAAASPSVGADLAPPPHRYVKAPVYRTVYVAPFTWQGFYGDFNGGYGWGDSTLTAGGASTTVHPDGALIGTGLGYNFQTGNIVFGIEGDLDYSWMKDTNAAVAPCPSCQVRNHYLATLRGRLGYAFNRWLPYITGGAAFGDIAVTSSFNNTQVDNKVGWTLGGGIEYAFPASHWSTKLEYLYADLGSATCDPAYCGVSTTADFKANIVRAGLNYRF